jgi:hypothetical protein
MLVVRTRFWPYPPPPLARRRPYPGARVAVPARVPGYTVIPGTMAIPLFAGLLQLVYHTTVKLALSNRLGGSKGTMINVTRQCMFLTLQRLQFEDGAAISEVEEC